MKNRARSAVTLIMLSGLMLSCMLPGMIAMDSSPDGPMPYMEENTEEVIKVLTGTDWHSLRSLAPEQYTDEDYAKPGTLTYNVTIVDEVPTYFSYGWCAVDEETLRQNFEHIEVKLYINGDEITSDAVHNLSFTAQNELLCLDFGVLMSEWPEGEYKLEAIVTFDEKINDGLADFEAGDYIFIYNVSVKKTTEGAFAPSKSINKTVLQ